MKPKIQTAILFFLTAVFAVSAFMLVRQMTSYRAGDEAYAEASEIAAIPEVLETETVQQPTEQPQQETQTEPEPAPSADPYAQALEQMDLPALQQVNSDVIGWIAIPGTEISYPLGHGQRLLSDTHLEPKQQRSRRDFHGLPLLCRFQRL